ncbi:t-SNARE affecting a late Golgi compartment protein 1 [Yarrowia sp. B02]|nr:t-SNARE affecting a late Golgi compartment protein 1 [Yarrowia sp. B02]
MDPFVQVCADAQSQLTQTRELLEAFRADPSNHNTLQDLTNTTEDLAETISDLSQSVEAAQGRPQQFGLSAEDIQDRSKQVAQLMSQLGQVQKEVSKIRNTGTPQGLYSDSVDDTEAKTAGLTQQMYASQIEEQDNALDGVYNTVNSLREQANVMSRELEDQSYLIDDLDRHADSAGSRLQRGLKKVDWVVRKNQETLGSCCITLLIVALIILLILLIAL